MPNLIPFGGLFEVERKKERLLEIQEMESMEWFCNDADNASKIQKEKSILEDVVSTYLDLKALYDDFETLIEFVEEDDDEDSASESLEIFQKF